MTRARDVANVLSTATDLATDVETAAAVSAHNSATNGHTSRGNTAGRPASPTAGDIYVNTQTGFVEVYTGATYGWEQVGGISSTPTISSVTNSGTGRAYNNGSASIAFSPGTILGRSYTVTSSPGSYTATGTTSPISITGLQSNTSYTYTVTATNNYGTSSASSASTGVVATTVPQAPTIGTATGADSSATLTFTAGATGGSSITNYKYSTDNSTYTAFSPAQTSSPLSISGLTNGTSYSFYLKAVNTNGDSTASSASNSIVPISTSFESIATTTVGPSGSASITFTDNGAWTNYTHLQIRGILRNTGSIIQGINGDLVVRFNSDSGSNYADGFLYGVDTTGIGVDYETNVGRMYFGNGTGNTATANAFGSFVIDILDFKNTNKYKSVRTLMGNMQSSYGQAFLTSGIWLSTNAITSLTFTSNNGNFAQYSKFALYGIKA